MMKNFKLCVAIGLLLMVCACTSYKQVPYLQNSDSLDPTVAIDLFDARIQPKDILSITVSGEEADAAVPFNLTVATRSAYSTPTLQTYLVDNDGCVEFPTLGKVNLGGLTKKEAEALIKARISPFFKDDKNLIVTVRMENYKISVIGEVTRPNIYTVRNEKVNIFEALAMAGDLTIYGRRDGVKLIRENVDGTKVVATLNLNDANLIYSPYYYLHQNDIVYVEPNKVKAQNADIGSMTSLWFSATSILMSAVTLLYNILGK